METEPITLTTVTVNIEDEMRQSYMDYAMSVIIGRALPDVRDGLKPVQRRILFAMYNEGLTSSKKHSKCAGVVGEVLKRFHPHGDSSVYEALVRLAQPWNMRAPLIDGQGNFGSIDGDPAAAYRYTECRLTAFAEKLLEDIDQDTVDFVPNFDDTMREPLVLPSLLPNLLINGADGIAVGMATHIPPHNTAEVIDGLIALIENPQLSLAELMKHIPGPDFPTGGIIYGREPLISAYAQGKGIIQVRAKAEIESFKSGTREGEAIVVSEIPFQVNKARLIERVAELVNNRQIDGIQRIRDESDRSGMRIVMELKREATAEIVLNQLYKLTPMQESFGVINLAIVDGKPVVCSLIELLRHFLNHRRDVVRRRTQFQLHKAQERMHILEGLKVVLLNLDDVIQLIKTSATPLEARDGLMRKYGLSMLQANAILDLRLQKLTGMERLAVEKEHQELGREIERLLAILADAKKIDAIIVQELKTARAEFADPRRTAITEKAGEMQIEDLIEDEDMVVTISRKGYMKRSPLSTYRAQRRGGKGVTGAPFKEDDFIEHLFVASTLSDLLVFTDLGRLYWIKVYEIPEGGRTARGRALVNLVGLRAEETVTAILPVRQFIEERWVFMATKRGIVKKSALMDFSRARRNGIIACTLDEGDQLISVAILQSGDEIILATKNGMAIRFSESEVRAMGRSARGVRGINLDVTDMVVSMTVVAGTGGEMAQGETRVSRAGTLLTVCENGYGKRTSLEDYRLQGRGGKGIIDIKTEGRNGPVVGVSAVQDESDFMIITSSGKVIRINAKDISVIGRNTKGVRLVDLDEGEKVAAVAHLIESEEEE